MKVLNYVTHGGIFHADECAGEAVMRLVCRNMGYALKTFRLENLEDAKKIPGPKIIADILREHQPALDHYDHHQGGLKRLNGRPYATFGLIWEQYGSDAIGYGIGYDRELLRKVWARVDKEFVEGIDAHDDDPGYYVEAFCSAGEVRPVTISHIIASMNGDPKDVEGQKERYSKAVDFLEQQLTNAIKRAWSTETAIAKWGEVAKEAAPDIFVLRQYMPWHEAVAEMEPEALFVIHPSGHPGSPWSLQAVPVKLGRRDLKMPIERPEWFSGFIHNGKFIAGCASKEEAIKLALWHTGG